MTAAATTNTSARVEVTGSGGHYRARRTTIERIKRDILAFLAAVGPSTANELKYEIVGGTGYLLDARRELECDGRVERVESSGGRALFRLAAR